MSTNATASSTAHVFRIDKFVVPASARSEFLTRVGETHALLRTLPGFVQDWIFEQTGGPGHFNLVTTVEWSSQEAVEKARPKILELQHQAGFDAGALMARLGISVDAGAYAPVVSHVGMPLRPGPTPIS